MSELSEEESSGWEPSCRGASVCWRYNAKIESAHQHLLAGHGGLVAADRLLDQQLGLGYKVVGDCNTMTQKNAAQNGKYLEEF